MVDSASLHIIEVEIPRCLVIDSQSVRNGTFIFFNFNFKKLILKVHTAFKMGRYIKVKAQTKKLLFDG